MCTGWEWHCCESPSIHGTSLTGKTFKFSGVVIFGLVVGLSGYYSVVHNEDIVIVNVNGPIVFFEVFAISLGVSMDAFAVSISKGLSIRRTTARQCASVALWFGGFQALFPLIGYFAAAGLRSYITSVDHWIIFGLLSAIGANMIREGIAEQSDEEHRMASSFGWHAMLPLAVATSIDAFAVGIGISVVSEGIWPIIITIGIMTAALSIAGLRIGNVFGSRWRKPAQICGGSVLILLGLEILLDHLGFFEAVRAMLS